MKGWRISLWGHMKVSWISQLGRKAEEDLMMVLEKIQGEEGDC